MKSLGEEFKEKKKRTRHYNRAAFQTVWNSSRYHQQNPERRDKVATLCNSESTE